MTVLREIHAWSKGLPAWQQDAIARLFVNRNLSSPDIEHIYALAKAAADIPDAEGRKPKQLLDADLAPPPDPTRLVQLVAIKDVTNVNALANGTLPLAPTGLTVIYGENGAGKSGYSRILKHACRARDQREAILPDAKLAPRTSGVAKAIFDVLVDGQPDELAWTYKTTPPEALADISIFDSHCARAYIDNDGDFAYSPHGLDILEDLVALLNTLRKRATDEKAANAPSNAAYAALTTEKTAVAAALNGIPAHTKAEDIETLASLSEAEQLRLELLVKALAEADPKLKAQAISERVMRLTGLKERFTATINILSDQKITELQELINKQKVAREAANIAAEGFKATHGQLPGTGSDEWKELFETARAFAVLSHAEHKFPNLPPESACPLCQNQLGIDGSARLLQFDAFIKQRAEQVAVTTRQAAEEAYRTIIQANQNLGLAGALEAELMGIDAQLAASCIAYQAALVTRQAAVRQAAATKHGWDEIAALPDDLRPALDRVIVALQAEAKALISSADDRAKAAMVIERAELDARRRLADVKDAVLDAIAKNLMCQKLQKCIDSMGTGPISRKSTDISNTVASSEVAAALNSELKKLNVHDLKAVMKPTSTKGRPQYKLVLELPGGGSPATILSEGEQRAIALASFLTEIKLAKSKGGLVFDDPVSSLDHRRRWEVADRLAKEALTRQVIIFTHDIYFLCIIEQKAREADAPLTTSYIRKTSAGFGTHTEGLPFDILGTKERVARLRNGLVQIRKAKHDGDDDTHRRLTSAAYGDLRQTWERGVEEVLFNGAIQRFGEGISTQNLKAVTVTNEDYKAIYDGMTKCSKFEHDAAPAVGRLPIPDPDELHADIERLETWRKKTIDRYKELRVERT